MTTRHRGAHQRAKVLVLTFALLCFTLTGCHASRPSALPDCAHPKPLIVPGARNGDYRLPDCAISFTDESGLTLSAHYIQDRYPTAVTVEIRDDVGHLVQTLQEPTTSGDKPLGAQVGPVTVVDFDHDGHQDLRIDLGGGATNSDWSLWHQRPNHTFARSGQFLGNDDNQTLSDGLYYVHSHGSAAEGAGKYYILDQDTLMLVGRVHLVYRSQRGPGDCVLQAGNVALLHLTPQQAAEKFCLNTMTNPDLKTSGIPSPRISVAANFQP